MSDNKQLDELRDQVAEMQSAAYTFGEYSMEAVRIALDGVIDVIDELAATSTKPADGVVEAGGVKTWQERTSIPMPEPHEMLFSMRQIHAAKDAEIADLRAQLVRQQAPVGDTINTHDFRHLLSTYIGASATGRQTAYSALIAHITAWKDAQLARERQDSQTVRGMADCMDMVRQELIEAGVIDKSVPPMMVANAVVSRLAAAQAQGEPVARVVWCRVNHHNDAVFLTEDDLPDGTLLYLGPAPQADEVRDAVLEEAAEICDDLHYKWRWDNEPDSDSGPRSCATAIRALKRTTAADNQKGGEA